MAEDTTQPTGQGDYSLVTLTNGAKFKLPVGLTDEQAMNMIAKAYPDYAEQNGFRYDALKEYDFVTGLPDLSTRWNLALTGGNPAEVSKYLNESVGRENWGMFRGSPFIKPEGLEALGIKDHGGRNRMIDGRGMEMLDLVDVAPEAAVMTVSTAAALATAPEGGIGGVAAGGAMRALMSRGLIASSARAGLGDAVARVGVQGVQELTGGNEETLGEIVGQAGMGGLITFAGGVALGAPIASLIKTAGAIKGVSTKLLPGQRGIGPAFDIDGQLKAEANIKNLTETTEHILLLSALIKSGAVSRTQGTILNQMEGLGIRLNSDAQASFVTTLINKIKLAAETADNIVIDPGASEAAIRAALLKKKAVYENALSASEKKLATDTYNTIMNWNKTPLGKEDAANATVRGFKDHTTQLIDRQIEANQKMFANADNYGSKVFTDAADITLTDARVVNFLNNLTQDKIPGTFSLSASEVLDTLPAGIKKLIQARGIQANNDDVFAVINKVPKVKKGASDQAVAKAIQKSPPSVTVGALMSAERELRSAAARAGSAGNRGQRAQLLDTSMKMQRAIETTTGVSKKFSDKLKEVNGRYGEFYRTFFGSGKSKNGIVDLLERANTDDPAAFINSLIRGKEGKEFTSVIEKLYKAFPDTDSGLAKAAKTGSFTADEILGNLGLSYLRNRKQALMSSVAGGSPQAVEAAAKKILKEFDNFEQVAKSKYIGKEPEGQAVWNKLFNDTALKGFRDTLNKVASGNPAGVARLGNALDFKEAQNLIAKMTSAAGSLERASMRDSLSTLERLAAVEPEFKELYQTMFVSEIWGDLLATSGVAGSLERVAAVSTWAKRWNGSVAAGNKDLLEGMTGKSFGTLNDTAIVLSGGTEFAKGAGSIAANTQVTSLLHRLLQGSLQGAMKPLVYMFAVRNVAPRTPVWNAASNYVRAQIASGSPVNLNQLATLVNPQLMKGVATAQRAANLVMRGRSGVAGSAIASYMLESGVSLPDEDEAPRVPVQKRAYRVEEPTAQVSPQEQQQAAAQQFGTALTNLLSAQRPSTFAGVGTSGLKTGMGLGAR